MPKYEISVEVSGSQYLGIKEFDTKEEAEKYAYDNAGTGLCYQCSSLAEDLDIRSVHISEVD